MNKAETALRQLMMALDAGSSLDVAAAMTLADETLAKDDQMNPSTPRVDKSEKRHCKYGDPFCPCQDGDACHYEGKDAWPAPQIDNAPERSMNTKQANAEAAKISKADGPRYVVYVFDEGQAVYTGQQVRMYAPIILIEALYVDGVCVATAEAAQAVAKL